jgi:hypothetical protein
VIGLCEVGRSIFSRSTRWHRWALGWIFPDFTLTDARISQELYGTVSGDVTINFVRLRTKQRANYKELEGENMRA